MSRKVFISGSISIKSLPSAVIKRLHKMIDNNLIILVGDATGIDTAIQHFFHKNQYTNVVVYSIFEEPRNLVSLNFKRQWVPYDNDSKSGREKQQNKDKRMTDDCDFSLVIWDGKSSGSYSNILRSLAQNKGVRVFLVDNEVNDFLPQEKINANEIDYIFRKNNGYSAAEVIEILKSEYSIYEFDNVRLFNDFLRKHNIIRKAEDKGIDLPNSNNDLFIIKKYKGKNTELRYKNEFIEWISKQIPTQNSMF